jgi:hypothetical protein
MLRSLAFRFALCFFDNFLAQFSFGGEGPPVDDAKFFFSLVVGQVRSSVVCAP